jgi:isocitrate/isopropylmalate dehydrogenase
MSAAQTKIPATLIPGDGIGPEITDAAVAVLDALGAPFEWDTQIAGLAGVKAAGDPLPQATLDSIDRTHLALKGPLETPSGGGYRSSNVRLREKYKLYANLRPAKTLVPGGRFEDIDLVLCRENNEGLYMGYEHYIPIDNDPHAVAIATGVNTRQGSKNISAWSARCACAQVDFQHLDLDDSPALTTVVRVLDEAVGQRRDVHQAVLVHADVDEGAEGGDVGDHAFEHHAGRRSLRSSTPSRKEAVLNSGRGSRPGFSSSCRMSCTVGRPKRSSVYCAASRPFSRRGCRRSFP